MADNNSAYIGGNVLKVEEENTCRFQTSKVKAVLEVTAVILCPVFSSNVISDDLKEPVFDSSTQLISTFAIAHRVKKTCAREQGVELKQEQLHKLISTEMRNGALVMRSYRQELIHSTCSA